MSTLHSLILDNIEILVVVTLVLLVCLILLVLIFLIRFGQLRKQYKRIMSSNKKLDLEQTLYQYVEQVQKALEQQDELSQSIQDIESRMRKKIGTAETIRFNAFGNTGSDLSYAVALLDSEGSGVVFSSIYGREESRTYAKPITNGNSSYLLTDEEKQAIQQATSKTE